MKGNTSVLSVVLERIHDQHFLWQDFIVKYITVLLDSIASLGPIAVLGVLGFAIKIFQKDKLFTALFIVLLLQFLGMAFLLIPLPGRGYATFNFSPLLCLGGGAFCSILYNWLASPALRRVILSSVALLIILYPHAAKLGYRLPNQIFYMGFNQISMPWEPYERRLFV